MIKVLHYVYKMDRGGIESFIMNLYRNIDRTKVQFHFAVHCTEKGHFDEEIEKLGGKIIYFPLLRENPIKFRKEWENFWRQNNKEYEAFHFHTPTLANIYAVKVAKKYNVNKIIIHAHNTHANKGKLQLIHDIIHKYHGKKIKYYANKFYTCSIPAAEWVFGKESSSMLDIEMLKNGIDLESFSFNRGVREKYKLEMNLEGKVVFGNIARFSTAKNHSFLIDIFREIVNLNPNSILLLIGTGTLEKEIKEKVEKLSLNDKVFFLGVREDISELMMVMDIFLLPSLYEGLPVTLIEAQASGLPILISNTIAPEVKLTNQLFFEDINKSCKVWAERSFNLINNKSRIDTIGILRECGYDIKEISTNYQHFLMNNN